MKVIKPLNSERLYGTPKQALFSNVILCYEALLGQSAWGKSLEGNMDHQLIRFLVAPNNLIRKSPSY